MRCGHTSILPLFGLPTNSVQRHPGPRLPQLLPWQCALALRPLHWRFGILEGRLVLFPHLFIYLFLSHLFIPELTDNLFSLGRNLIFSLFTLLLNLFQFWQLGVFPGWILMLFQNTPNLLSFPSFRESFLNFWHSKMSLAHLVFSLPLSQNQPFLWGAVVPLLLEIAFRNWDMELDLPGAPWVSLLRPRGGGSWWPRVCC